ncbi:hypothetical protein EW026_g3414 [Hermanssonia centrifuga]|uniref:Uncharacterized protein n=2 Tax=Hermanssonia centrifuga TaxID=98765 RepID=A0A2R6NYA2_9APHY|nr:hypothetical protein PHLCEN_2v6821 [Hermanssonia centrifuga]THG98848.1 hypothetical protein EW026_g3414 [Hermanssonia centrifuga]
MFMTTTTYFISATIWSEQEFVESTVNPGIFASLTSGRLAILKDTAICVNMWLADSLIVYRLFIIWDRNFYIIIFPVMTYIGSIVHGPGLVLVLEE